VELQENGIEFHVVSYEPYLGRGHALRKQEMSENPILDELVYDQESGSLIYKGVRYLMIRPETISGFQKAITESYGKEAGECFFEGGFEGGSLSAKKYKTLYNFSDLEVIEFMMKMGTQIGWGCFSLEHYYPEQKILCVSVAHSPFAEFYGTSSQGVCHLIRGVVAGIASILLSGECTTTEVECRAKGDKRCLFVAEGK
jgi:predicted hydrocarbon binding protein